MKALRLVRLARLLGIGAVLLWSVTDAQETAPLKVTFHIEAQPVGDALNAFAAQSGYQVLFLSELGKEITTPPVHGTLVPEQALQQLLTDSRLRYEFINPRTVTIRAATAKPFAHSSDSDELSLRVAQGNTPATPDPSPAKGGFWKRLRLAQAAEASSSAEQSDQNPKGDSGQGGQLEEIVVTAQKREERLMDVPISISAYDQETMDRRAIRDISDIASITPGLSFGTIGYYNRTTIRGISSDSGYQPGLGTATTAVYLDDVPLQARTVYSAGGFTSSYPKVFDLERVEVLRGPQGTLFGGSAMGGAVRFITPKPSLTDYDGYARTEIADARGGAMSYELGGAIGGPIIQDKLGFRLSGWHRRDGGYVDHYGIIPGSAQESDSNESDSYVGRASLLFAPADNIRLMPSLYVQELRERDNPRFFVDASDVDSDRFVNTDPLLVPVRDTFYVPSLAVDVDLGAVQLISRTAYFYRNNETQQDFTNIIPSLFGGPLPTSLDQYQRTFLRTRQRNFTQEVRISSSDPAARLQWTAGVYYSLARQRAGETVDAPSFPQFILDTFGQPIDQFFGSGLVEGRYSYISDVQTRDEELAGLANLEYYLTRRFSVIAGVRASHLKNSFDSRTTGPLAGGLQLREGTQKESPITPKFGINFKPNDNHLFYASVAKGFRPGGVNNSLPDAGPDCLAAQAELGTGNFATYESDSLWSYEVGSKNSFFGGRVRTSESVYRSDWSDILRSVNVLACLNSFIVNLAQAKVQGFDFAMDAKFFSSWTGGIAVGYTDATYSKTTVVSGVAVAEKGEQVSYGSPWTITASIQYDFAVSDGMDGYVRAEDRYGSSNSGRFPEYRLNPLFTADPATNQLNIRAGIIRGGLDLSVFATNLLNEHPILGRNAFGGFGGLYPSDAVTTRPFTVGVTATHRW